MTTDLTCPNCGAGGMEVFFELENVPVHSVQLLHTRQAALDFPRGDIRLAFCDTCEFVSNVAYDPALHDYSCEYESTQQFSETFSAFHRGLGERLIDRYGLHDKDVVEIGCGQGEFLAMLCESGNNRGIGYDPAFVPGRNPSIDGSKIRVVRDYFSEKYAEVRADFYCCKMTLEHIGDTGRFVGTVSRTVGDRPEATVFFQVPDTRRIMRELGFWDIYYEHCSYFGAVSLSHLFKSNGFDVLDLQTEYDDQYLMIEARPSLNGKGVSVMENGSLKSIRADVAYFADNWSQKVNGWRENLREQMARGRRTVIWGGGSKGVAFLTTLGITDEIGYAVDINELKHGTFMAGTGHEVVSPEFLRDYKPDTVIVMNPVYCDEIRRSLNQMNLSVELLTP